MKAKEYLQQIRNLDRKINIHMQDLNRWRRMAYSISNDAMQTKYDPNRHTNASYEKCIAEADALDRKICEEIDRLADMKEEARLKIVMIDGTDLQLILEMRYLQFMSWEDIGSEMNYGKSWIHQKHNDALDRLDAILN